MLFQITAAVLLIKNLSKHYDKKYFKLRHFYYKLYQKFITNYGSSNFPKLLIIITNYVSFQNYYKLRQKLLQITAAVSNRNIIKNYVVTTGLP